MATPDTDVNFWQFLWAILSLPIMAAWRRMTKQQDQITDLQIQNAVVQENMRHIDKQFTTVNLHLEQVNDKLDALLTRRRSDREEHNNG